MTRDKYAGAHGRLPHLPLCGACCGLAVELRDGRFVTTSWEEAFAEIETRLPPILARSGRDAAAGRTSRNARGPLLAYGCNLPVLHQDDPLEDEGLRWQRVDRGSNDGETASWATSRQTYLGAVEPPSAARSDRRRSGRLRGCGRSPPGAIATVWRSWPR